MNQRDRSERGDRDRQDGTQVRAPAREPAGAYDQREEQCGHRARERAGTIPRPHSDAECNLGAGGSRFSPSSSPSSGAHP